MWEKCLECGAEPYKELLVTDEWDKLGEEGKAKLMAKHLDWAHQMNFCTVCHKSFSRSCCCLMEHSEKEFHSAWILEQMNNKAKPHPSYLQRYGAERASIGRRLAAGLKEGLAVVAKKNGYQILLRESIEIHHRDMGFGVHILSGDDVVLKVDSDVYSCSGLTIEDPNYPTYRGRNLKLSSDLECAIRQVKRKLLIAKKSLETVKERKRLHAQRADTLSGVVKKLGLTVAEVEGGSVRVKVCGSSFLVANRDQKFSLHVPLKKLKRVVEVLNGP